MHCFEYILIILMSSNLNHCVSINGNHITEGKFFLCTIWGCVLKVTAAYTVIIILYFWHFSETLDMDAFVTLITNDASTLGIQSLWTFNVWTLWYPFMLRTRTWDVYFLRWGALEVLRNRLNYKQHFFFAYRKSFCLLLSLPNWLMGENRCIWTASLLISISKLFLVSININVSFIIKLYF